MNRTLLGHTIRVVIVSVSMPLFVSVSVSESLPVSLYVSVSAAVSVSVLLSVSVRSCFYLCLCRCVFYFDGFCGFLRCNRSCVASFCMPFSRLAWHSFSVFVSYISNIDIVAITFVQIHYIAIRFRLYLQGFGRILHTNKKAAEMINRKSITMEQKHRKFGSTEES